MLDYKYENTQYYEWITAVANYVEEEYEASVELTSEENGFIYEMKKNRVQIQGVYPPRDKLYVLLHEVILYEFRLPCPFLYYPTL